MSASVFVTVTVTVTDAGREASVVPPACTNAAAMRAQFGRRPDTKWERDFTRVRLLEVWDVASEKGNWAGSWTDPDGAVRFARSYLALWRRVAGAWRIRLNCSHRWRAPMARSVYAVVLVESGGVRQNLMSRADAGRQSVVARQMTATTLVAVQRGDTG